MNPVLAKVLAVCLLVLAFLPFTAPFATCDLATLLAGIAGQERPPPAGATSLTTPPSDSQLSQLVPVVRGPARPRPLGPSPVRTLNAATGPRAILFLDVLAAATVGARPVLPMVLRV
jgi:hypothetical protein